MNNQFCELYIAMAAFFFNPRPFFPVLAVFLGWSVTVSSHAAVRIEALQGPAWLERDGSRTPAQPSLPVEAGTTFRCGKAARAALRLDDGSRLNLGENTLLRLEPRAPENAAQLSIAHGSFLFSRMETPSDAPDNLLLKAGGLAIDIRHAEIWGAARAEGDDLCLLGGRVVLMRKGKLSSMENPPQCLDAITVQAPLDERLDRARLVEGRGIRRSAGRWQVNLLSLAEREPLLKMRDRLRQDGYPAEIVTVEVKRRKYFRLRIARFASRDDAHYLAKRLKEEKQAAEPWVSAD